MQMEFGLAQMTIDTEFTEISPCVVFPSPKKRSVVDVGRDEGRSGSRVPKQGGFSPRHRDHHLPPSNLTSS